MSHHRSAQRGQAIVIMVFILVGLLVVAGLAIDGGSAVLERRRMQNSADAAALAAARRLSQAICNDEGSTATDAAVLADMVAYARSNGAADANAVSGAYVRFAGNTVVDFTPPAAVGSGFVPNGAVGVRVTAAITNPTYFLGLVGQSTGGAGASATAVTGPLAVGTGIRPFGVSEEVIVGLNVGDCFIVDFKNCKESSPEGCLIRDATGAEISQHRGWMNLSHVWNQGESSAFPRAQGGNTSASELKEWMENGWTGMLWADCLWSAGCRWGDYMHAKPGTDSSVIGAVPVNTPFVIPVFDVLPDYDQIPAPKAGGASQGGSFYYHIVGFATVRVPSSGGYNQGQGWIKACIEQVVTGKGMPVPNEGFRSGSGACDRRTMAVTLWR